MNTPATPRPIAQTDRDKIAGVVRSGLTDLLLGEQGLLSGRPGFIAGGGPTDPLSNTVRAVSQLNCRVWAASDKSNQSVNVAQTNYNLCTPYLESIGEQPDDGDISPDFLGGQCPVVYTADILILGNPLSQGGRTPRNVTGPLGGVTRTDVVTNSPSPGDLLITYRFANNPSLNFVEAGVNPAQAALATLRLTRNDGQPDNCGNAPSTRVRLPSAVTPATPIPPRIQVNVPGIGPVNVNVNLDPVGNPVVCIEEIETCVTIDLDNGGGGGDGGGGGGGNISPTSPGEAGGDADTGEGGDAEGEAPEGKELTGLLVTVLSAAGGGNTFGNVSAVVYRGIGYVAMGYPDLLGIDTSAAVVESPQFFHPQQRGLTAWRVRANVGFRLRVTPYYRDVEE